MGLEHRLARLEARFGVNAPVDLAALLRQGANAATVHAALDRLIATGRVRADDFALIRNHPAFAADRARVRAKLRQWHQDRGDDVPADLADGEDPGRPFK